MISARRPMSASRNGGSRMVVALFVSAVFAVSGCGGASERAAGSATGDTPASSPTTALPPSSTPTSASPDFPPAVAPDALQHGGTYWGVYVAVVRTDDDAKVTPVDQQRLDAAKKSLTDLGYEPAFGAYDVGCDQGMREQLHLDPRRQYAAVQLYFATRERAAGFVEAYQPGVVGTAKVTLYCMD